jgi:hypothetical protein
VVTEGLTKEKDMLDLIDRLFNQHKLVRRLGVIGVYFLIAFATFVVFTHLGRVSAPVVAAYGTLCGLLAVVFKFYTDARSGDG